MLYFNKVRVLLKMKEKERDILVWVEKENWGKL